MSIALPKRRNGATVLTPEQKRHLADYVRAKRVANEAALIVEQTKAAALAIVQLAGGSVVLGPVMLQNVPSISYMYSAALTRRKLELRNAEKIEQLDGSAKKIERPCLVMIGL